MDTLQRNKATARALWAALDDDPSRAAALLQNLTSWHGPSPFGTMHSGEAVVQTMFAPLRAAVPDLHRQVHIFMGGTSAASEDNSGDGASWVAATGYYCGTQSTEIFGVPATGHPVRIRWGEFLKFDDDGRIIHAQTIWDFVDWFDQIGLPVLPKPKGAAHVYPAPTGYLGQLDDPQNADVTAETLAMGQQFIFGGLNAFDESDLASMGMAQFFHPNVKWYGPGGIGACMSLKEFEDLHQAPWLVAFPDRKVMHLESLFAEDRLLAASGPRGVVAHQTGPYLDHPPSGAPIEVSGIDFWLRDGDKFTENWVFVDMLHLFSQMGVDLMARMRAQIG